MIKKEDVQASTASDATDKLFGSVDDYHVINYKKSPFVLYQNFFSHSICDKILSLAELYHYEKFNDKKSSYEYIDLRKRFLNKNLKWIINPLDKLVKDANNKNFLLDITQIEHMAIKKFCIDDGLDWHHDCDWWYNPFPYDKKLTIVVELSDALDFTGGNYLEFMSTVPIPQQYFTKGSVLIFPCYNYYSLSPITKGNRNLLFLNVIGPKFK